MICRTCVFPLSAGTIDSGLKAIESVEILTDRRKLNDYPLVAIIVEPRKENLVRILKHFIRVLPNYTHFQVYHGKYNRELLYTNFRPLINSGKMSLWDLNIDNLTIQGYSALLTSKAFWNTIQSEQVLVFQTDAITCEQSKFDITDFQDYDFVGAPIPRHISILIGLLFMCKGYIIGHIKFFNGGLSFRKRSKMLAVINEYPWDRLCPEDVWFCSFLPRVGGVLPDKNQARKFSFESEELTHTPWGVHKPRKEYNKLCKICPEFTKIPITPAHSDYRSLFLL